MYQSYTPHLKVLVCGINGSSSQWCGCIFILCYIHLKLALLLNKKGLVATGVATTVLYPLKEKSSLNQNARGHSLASFGFLAFLTFFIVYKGISILFFTL